MISQGVYLIIIGCGCRRQNKTLPDLVENNQEENNCPLKKYKYHVWEYVYIFFLKSLNVVSQVVQLLCCPSQIEKLLSFRKIEKKNIKFN